MSLKYLIQLAEDVTCLQVTKQYFYALLVKTLEKRGFYKEAEDLQEIAEKYYLPENRTIILKIIIEMQRAAVSDEKNKFEQLLQKL